MDQTPRRVAPTAADLRGRSGEEIVPGSDETVRNYVGAEGRPMTDDGPGPRIGGEPSRSADSAAASGRSGDDADDPELTERTTQIRSEIEQAREEMTETIDAIQEKLRPSNIVANATERVKQATTEGVRSMADMASGTANDMIDYGRDAYGSVAGEVRHNPIPIAMIGIGAAWLLMGHNKGNRGSWRGGDDGRNRQHEGIWRRAHREQYESSANPAGSYESRSPSYRGNQSDGGGITDAIANHPVPAALAAMGIAWLAFGDRRGSDWSRDSGWTGSESAANDRWRRQFRPQGQGIGEAAGSGGSTSRQSTSASDMYESVKDSAQSVASTAEQYASQAQDYAGEAMHTVQRRRRDAQNELQRMMQENPLLVGAGALAVGAMIGMALPETERENEWMGEARDSMVEQAETMARDAASKVQSAAGDVVGEVASRVVGGE